MPARLAAVASAAAKRGVEVRRPRKGSHWKAIRASDGKVYPLPAHNGLKTELPDVYLRGLCRCFAWDFAAFVADL